MKYSFHYLLISLQIQNHISSIYNFKDRPKYSKVLYLYDKQTYYEDMQHLLTFDKLIFDLIGEDIIFSYLYSVQLVDEDYEV